MGVAHSGQRKNPRTLVAGSDGQGDRKLRKVDGQSVALIKRHKLRHRRKGRLFANAEVSIALQA